MKRGMPETAEIFAVIAALAMAALLVAPQPGHVRVVVRRVLWARNWPAVALGALATVSAKNYLDPGHRLDAATEQTVPSR
jgi:hypothetical protein